MATLKDAGSELGQKISKFDVLRNKAESDTESEEFFGLLGRRPNSTQTFFAKNLVNIPNTVLLLPFGTTILNLHFVGMQDQILIVILKCGINLYFLDYRTKHN